jgi:hypothetical protein
MENGYRSNGCVSFVISQVDISSYAVANHDRIRFPTQLKAPNQHCLEFEIYQCS